MLADVFQFSITEMAICCHKDILNLGAVHESTSNLRAGSLLTQHIRLRIIIEVCVDLVR